MAGTQPALHGLTPYDQGGAVVVAAYALVANTILFSLVRMATARVLKRALGLDDAFALAATLAALAQSILIDHAVDNGLGRHQDRLSAGELSAYYKLSFAASFIAIIAMLCAKVSVLFLILRVAPPSTSLRRSCHGSIWVCIGWAVFSILALAFQCDLPKSWIYTPQRCSNSGAVWYPIVIFNILTDLIPTFLFFPSLRKLQMRQTRLVMLAFLFGSRILTCAAAVAQLALLPHAVQSTDQTWGTRQFVILSQVVMNTSIITANVPPLSKLLSGIHIGDGARISQLALESTGNGSLMRGSRGSKTTLRQNSQPKDGSGNSSGAHRNNLTSNQTGASGDSRKASVATPGGVVEVPEVKEYFAPPNF